MQSTPKPQQQSLRELKEAVLEDLNAHFETEFGGLKAKYLRALDDKLNEVDLQPAHLRPPLAEAAFLAFVGKVHETSESVHKNIRAYLQGRHVTWAARTVPRMQRAPVDDKVAQWREEVIEEARIQNGYRI